MTTAKTAYIEEHEGVLLHVESLIVYAYKQYPKLHDHDVIRVLDHLIKYFRAEATNFPITEPSFSKIIETELYTSLKANLENLKDYTPEDNYNLLKFLKKSVELWNRKGGSQGYLTYITRFIDVEVSVEE